MAVIKNFSEEDTSKPNVKEKRRKPHKGLGEEHFRQKEGYLSKLSDRNKPGLFKEQKEDKCGYRL